MNAVLCLLVVACLLGHALRDSIRVREPLFERSAPGHAITSLETLSHWVLTVAYFISVAYHLSLLGKRSN